MRNLVDFPVFLIFVIISLNKLFKKRIKMFEEWILKKINVNQS